MTIATDIAAYHVATKRVQVTSTSKALFGASGLLAEANPGNVRQIALIPAAAGVYYNFGTASAATGVIPAGGIVLNVSSAGVQCNALELYAAASTYVAVTIFEYGGTCQALGGGLTVLEANIGNVGLLNAAETEIDPSEAQATNTAFAAADMVTPAGAVRKDTEALPEDVANGDYVPLQTDATGSLRTTDDTANTSLASVLAAIRPAGAPTPIAAKTSGAGWDADSDEATIPANTLFLHVHVTEDTYLLANTSTDDPATACVYEGGQTHVLPCWGQTKLHYKQVAAAATITMTAFLAS